MSVWEKGSLLALMSLMILSGSTYFFIKYGIENDDPFSVVNHPLEPIALKLHVLAGPFLIFVVGILFRSHVWEMLSRKHIPTKTGGLLTAFLFVVTVLSGYLLQTITSPVLHDALTYLHPAIGLCFTLVLGSHALRRKNRGRTVRKIKDERRLVA
jgi:hypothetical protein